MAERFEGDKQLNEVIFQDAIDSFPLRDNYEKVAQVAASHATDIEALENGGSPPASSSAEVIAARDEAASLSDRLHNSQENQPWGIFPSVLNEMIVSAQGTPDDTVEVDTGQGMVNGQLFRETSTQTVDPADFAGGEGNPRIDVVHVSADGTVAVTTGLPAITPIPEQIPANTIELAQLYLKPSGGTPNVPKDIKDFNDGSRSFILLKLDRFLRALKGTHPRRIALNLVRNGSFAVLDDTGAIWDWTANNVNLLQNVNNIFPDRSMKVANDGTNSVHFASTSIAGVDHLRGHWLTVAFWIMAGPIAVSGDFSCAIKIKQTGDSPEQDVTVTARINKFIWQRVVAQAYIDNETTAVDIEIYPNGVAVQANTKDALVDGVMATKGLDVLGFEYPPRVVFEPDGSVKVMDLEAFNDLIIGNDATIGNDLTVGNDAEIGNDLDVLGVYKLNGEEVAGMVNPETIVDVTSQSITTGAGTDLYTVPASKKVYITDFRFSIEGVSGSPTSLQVFIGGNVVFEIANPTVRADVSDYFTLSPNELHMATTEKITMLRAGATNIDVDVLVTARVQNV